MLHDHAAKVAAGSFYQQDVSALDHVFVTHLFTDPRPEWECCVPLTQQAHRLHQNLCISAAQQGSRTFSAPHPFGVDEGNFRRWREHRPPSRVVATPPLRRGLSGNTPTSSQIQLLSNTQAAVPPIWKVRIISNSCPASRCSAAGGGPTAHPLLQPANRGRVHAISSSGRRPRGVARHRAAEIFSSPSSRHSTIHHVIIPFSLTITFIGDGVDDVGRAELGGGTKSAAHSTFSPR